MLRIVALRIVASAGGTSLFVTTNFVCARRSKLKQKLEDRFQTCHLPHCGQALQTADHGN
jgi:hypothetical protein